ncbi:S-methyl-5-thioribose kinase [Macrococcus equipercicus]|uniref:S-methyl-5-thioribose kinase n=1 Tax=Macrococcus equipercicus TaxID=69967 RepID=A0A9Q9F1V0_9STAP|nr:S-methyl-5-thioribose kinase [Macrococcus equipercicus]KAA1037626.1 S-methyl-5-thioribose kinase [Macrococcus equipercicus]UTH14140.1 S-methyl-5-thioribose kinase [Macrococcus equipercicus]
MSQFEEYFLMDEEAVKAYVRHKTEFFGSDELIATEIGDGNLNYVFRVEDSKGQSVIVKHSGRTARISDEFVLSTDRTIREGKLLEVHGSFVPDLTPTVYLVDETMKCVIMEDLADHKILRSALNTGDSFPNLGEDLGRYLAETLINTSDFVLHPKEKKALQQEMINPELCEISEDLVYTEPFYDNNHRNEVSETLAPFVQSLLYDDEELKVAVAQAKLKFMNKAEALIHGDLHTGSVFVNRDSTKVIDPEFGFFGPAGYDVGNVIAHLFFAYAHAEAQHDLTQAHYIETVINEVQAYFKSRALKLLKDKTRDVSLKQEKVFASYIREIERDAHVIAGLEIIRRIVGLAKVSDITSLSADVRLQKEVQLLKFAKFLVQYPEEARVYPSLFSIYNDYEVQVA